MTHLKLAQDNTTLNDLYADKQEEIATFIQLIEDKREALGRQLEGLRKLQTTPPKITETGLLLLERRVELTLLIDE